MYTLDYKKYAEKIREAVSESVILLKNENKTLPINKDEKVTIFGRAQIDTYYCGTGSGGMVNIPYLVNIANGIKAKREINQEVYQMYVDFISENPFDKGKGWAQEPFSQKDLVLTEEVVTKASKETDIALFVVGRSAGEDKDVKPEGGSYYLSDVEKANLKLVCDNFDRVAVILNVGGVMDTSFMNEYKATALVYAWHGGIESGNGYADVLCGDVSPSGVLPDTIAYSISDYPSNDNFGSDTDNVYAEDIYVGYRYFETFAKDKVMYPFGFGLSYSTFALAFDSLVKNENDVDVTFTVTNTGEVEAKRTVQLYVQAPIGTMGKATVVLAGFAKTKALKPNEAQTITVTVKNKDFASFDDIKSAFVLEKGKYNFFIGFNSRDIMASGEIVIANDELIEQCNSALMPIKEFKKMTAVMENGEYKLAYTNANLRPYSLIERTNEENNIEVVKTNFGYTFADVKSGKISALDLANDLSDLELIQLSRGEGMCSPKVTAGTAGCYGGVTDALKIDRKMPIVCCSDGPSGIRMDCGTMAYSLPNATAIASTFNPDLVVDLFNFLSLELAHHSIDTLLGPGMNIHRHPLCGRNFEYYSEDPFLTGVMAKVQIEVMNKYNVTGTIKHFAANNQEKARKTVNATVSARALREIYLKGFEMAVRDGGAFSVMTAYNPINGTQAASNYDLNTTILRKDWGFDGVVMTDWWATMNKEGGEAKEQHTGDMIASQNDVFMVTGSSEKNSMGDNSEAELANGGLKRYSMVRNAVNIINSMVTYNCSSQYPEVAVENVPENTFAPSVDLGAVDVNDFVVLDHTKINTEKGIANKIVLNLPKNGSYRITFDLFADAIELAQVPMTIKINGAVEKVITLKGGDKGIYTCDFFMFATISTYTEFFFGESGMVINRVDVTKLD